MWVACLDLCFEGQIADSVFHEIVRSQVFNLARVIELNIVGESGFQFHFNEAILHVEGIIAQVEIAEEVVLIPGVAFDRVLRPLVHLP